MNPLYSRVDLACEQLDVAIELFFANRSFVSSLTLAGAAEEVLGVEVKNRGGSNTLSRRHDAHRYVARRLANRRLYPSVNFREQTLNEFREKQNYPRNAAKHIADKKASRRQYDKFFRANPKVACITMILRALHNQELLALPRSELGYKFYGWHMASIYSTEPDEP